MSKGKTKGRERTTDYRKADAGGGRSTAHARSALTICNRSKVILLHHHNQSTSNPPFTSSNLISSNCLLCAVLPATSLNVTRSPATETISGFALFSPSSCASATPTKLQKIAFGSERQV